MREKRITIARQMITAAYLLAEAVRCAGITAIKKDRPRLLGRSFDAGRVYFALGMMNGSANGTMEASTWVLSVTSPSAFSVAGLSKSMVKLRQRV